MVGSDWWGEYVYAILLTMRMLRNFSTDRCYHLVSRVANKAFYFTEEELICRTDAAGGLFYLCLTPIKREGYIEIEKGVNMCNLRVRYVITLKGRRVLK